MDPFIPWYSFVLRRWATPAEPSPPTTRAVSLLEQRIHDLQRRRSDEDHENPREDEQHQREDQLNSGLGSLLLCELPPPRPHGIRLHAQGLRDARPKAVCLNQ